VEEPCSKDDTSGDKTSIGKGGAGDVGERASPEKKSRRRGFFLRKITVRLLSTPFLLDGTSIRGDLWGGRPSESGRE